METQTLTAPKTVVAKRQSTLLETISVAEFLHRYDLIDYHKVVRENSNSLPYITFMNSSNVASNIYFSQAEGVKHSAGESVEDIDFSKLVMSHISYPATADTEAYSVWKISSGNSLRGKTSGLKL